MYTDVDRYAVAYRLTAVDRYITYTDNSSCHSLQRYTHLLQPTGHVSLGGKYKPYSEVIFQHQRHAVVAAKRDNIQSSISDSNQPTLCCPIFTRLGNVGE